MEDELTTEMYAEFMDGEITPLQMRCFGVYARMLRGETKTDALKAYNLTEKEYDDNIDAALQA